MEFDTFTDGMEIVTEADGSRHAQRKPGEEICDFCCGDPATDPVRWGYPTGELAIQGHPVIQASKDDWAACEACHVLIEADALASLAARSFDVQILRFGPVQMLGVATVSSAMRAAAIEQIQRHLSAWSDARTGDAYPEPDVTAPHGKGQRA